MFQLQKKNLLESEDIWTRPILNASLKVQVGVKVRGGFR